MTNEEAIKVQKWLGNNHFLFAKTFEDVKASTDIAIKALEQQTCDDCISRPAVLDTLDKMDKALDTDRTVENYKKLLTECYKDLPPIIPLPKPYKAESEE